MRGRFFVVLLPKCRGKLREFKNNDDKMKKFLTHPIGIEQGEDVLFSEFAEGGDMWTGQGPRERRTHIRFKEAFRTPPVVQIGISLWDVDTSSALRAEVQAEHITAEGFDAVFRTWSDTRIARIRASWTAIGEVAHPDDWNIS
ncbi:H-type lectin domain protein [Ruegeria sp. THAF33]|nr:H-type lectin domain protein [Ruegeria sp. THAF33]